MDEERIRFLMRRINECPFNAANGITVRTAGGGSAEVCVKLTQKSKNVWGVAHGGLLFAAADVAAGLAAQTVHNEVTLTVSASIDYLAPARDAEEIIAKAVELKHGRSLGYYRVDVTDGAGTQLAAVQMVIRLLEEHRAASE